MLSYQALVGAGKKKRSFSEIDVERAKTYSCEDADVTLQLMSVLQKALESDRNQDLFYDMEMRLVPVLMDMESAGIMIDIPFFHEMSGRFALQIKEIEKEIYEEAGMEFNIKSPQQLGFVLFEKLQLPVQKKTTKTKSYSTDAKVLKKLSALPHKTPKLLLRYRTLSKLKSTYLDALVKMVNPSTGRVHTSFNQTVTATGRLSSSNPNLQNIPVRGEEGREIRKGFVAEKGHYLLSADYSQVELRVLAHYSGDPSFVEAFEREEDIHARTASEILQVSTEAVTSDMRRIAKAINFGIIYGMGAQRLAEELGIDVKTAKKYIEAYYKRYQGVTKYREKMIDLAREKGYVRTLFNRRRVLPEINHSQQRFRAEAERMAVNTPIQGTAADLIKKAMINIHKRLERENLRTKMILQVHDELLFEVKEDETDLIRTMVKEEMEGVHRLDVPLKVDVKVGKNWDEAH
jgi:DNA polymerase-1